jgi:predicted nucleic acid-binding protein
LLIDASTAAAWLLPGQRTATGDALLAESSAHSFSAPHLFPAEIRNALLMLEWGGRLNRVESNRAVAALFAYGIAIEPAPTLPEYEAILDLSRREHLTVYYGLYLWQAMRADFTLASRDGDLLAAALRNSVAVRDVRQ